MKIGNSTIQFNLTVKITPSGEKCTLQNVPYWKLYSRQGDCISNDWHSTRALTYEEIVEYLTNYKGHRILEAYPRFSLNVRNRYIYKTSSYCTQGVVIDKHTDEIVCIIDLMTSQILYKSKHCKSVATFKRYFAIVTNSIN